MELRWRENIRGARLSWAAKSLRHYARSLRAVIRRTRTIRWQTSSVIWCRMGTADSGRGGLNWERRSGCWERWGWTVGAGTAQAYSGSVTTRTWRGRRRDCWLCRSQSRFPGRIGRCCSGPLVVWDSASSSCSWVWLDISKVTGHSLKEKRVRVKTFNIGEKNDLHFYPKDKNKKSVIIFTFTVFRRGLKTIWGAYHISYSAIHMELDSLRHQRLGHIGLPKILPPIC